MGDYNGYCQGCSYTGNYFCDVDNKCYSDNRVDTCEHNFIFQPNTCKMPNILMSDACDLVQGLTPLETYYRMLYFNPGTGCSFRVYNEYSYILFKNVQWPLQIFARTNQMTNHKDIEHALPIMRAPEEIRYDFEFEQTYFYIVNWSDDQIAGAELEMMVTFLDGQSSEYDNGIRLALPYFAITVASYIMLLI